MFLVLGIEKTPPPHVGKNSQIREAINLENIARVRNCPDVTILISLFGLCLQSFCLFDILYFCHFVFFFFLLCLCLFVRHLADKMSEGSQVSRMAKVTLCVKIQKWQSVTDAKGRYRAARAAKNHPVYTRPTCILAEGLQLVSDLTCLADS